MVTWKLKTGKVTPHPVYKGRRRCRLGVSAFLPQQSTWIAMCYRKVWFSLATVCISLGRSASHFGSPGAEWTICKMFLSYRIKNMHLCCCVPQNALQKNQRRMHFLFHDYIIRIKRSNEGVADFSLSLIYSCFISILHHWCRMFASLLQQAYVWKQLQSLVGDIRLVLYLQPNRSGGEEEEKGGSENHASWINMSDH